MADEKQESRYKALVEPEFKSTIPPHLLAKMPESDRYLVEMVSKMEERDKWMIVAVKDGNHANIELDIRVDKLERFKERVTSKWSVLAYLVAAALPVALKYLFDYWSKP